MHAPELADPSIQGVAGRVGGMKRRHSTSGCCCTNASGTSQDPVLKQTAGGLRRRRCEGVQWREAKVPEASAKRKGKASPSKKEKRFFPLGVRVVQDGGRQESDLQDGAYLVPNPGDPEIALIFPS